MTLFRTGILEYHPLQRILRLPVFSQFKMQMVAGRYAGMTDITDILTYADNVPFLHMQSTQVRIQRGKTARMPDFDVPTITAAILGFDNFSAS